MSSRRARSGGSSTAPDRERRQQRRVELAFGGEIAERLGARAHERDLGALELRQQERESLLLGLRVLADLGAIERAVARLLEQRQRIGDEPRAVARAPPTASPAAAARARRCRGRCPARPGSAPACARRAAAPAGARRRAPPRPCRAPRATRAAAPSPTPILSARATVPSSFCSPTGFSRKSKAPILVASTAVSMVPWPDIITTGIVSWPAAAHSRSSVTPSVSGIQMSSSTSAGCCSHAIGARRRRVLGERTR